jgi:hypothetical protein
MKHMKHVIAVFDGLDDALRAVAALEREDLPSSRISLLARAPDGDAPAPALQFPYETVIVRGTGTTIVAGPMAAVLRGAATANAEVDLTAILGATGVEPHQAIRYEWALRHGKTLVVTTVGAAKSERITRVLSLCYPIERVSAA